MKFLGPFANQICSLYRLDQPIRISHSFLLNHLYLDLNLCSRFHGEELEVPEIGLYQMTKLGIPILHSLRPLSQYPGGLLRMWSMCIVTLRTDQECVIIRQELGCLIVQAVCSWSARDSVNVWAWHSSFAELCLEVSQRWELLLVRDVAQIFGIAMFWSCRTISCHHEEEKVISIVQWLSFPNDRGIENRLVGVIRAVYTQR